MVGVRILPQYLCRFRLVVRRIAVLVICVMCLPSVLMAGIEEFNNSLDVTLYKLASENNDASAQYLIARKYLRGKSVDKSTKSAIKWLKRASNQGHAKAQFQLGLIHLKGLGVKVDNKLAKSYFLRAANNGLDDAQFQLGQFYRRGLGGKKNRRKSVKWYKKSIAQDNILAQFILGKMYLEGDGISRDYVKAMEWLGQAASSGDFQATKLLKKFEKEKPGAYREAKRLASQGGQRKTRKLATNRTNQSKSKRNTKKSTKKNPKQTAEDMLQSGMNYLHGEHGHKVNVSKGISLIKSAAKKGHPVAQYDYGVLLSQNNFMDVDIARAVYWLEKAVKGGVDQAKPVLTKLQFELMLSDKIRYASTPDEQYKLATQYLLGNVIDKDISEAFQWYLKAARQKHLKSQYQVGAMYHAGSGVSQNTKKARYWLVKAAQRGIADADNLLLEIDIEKDRLMSLENRRFEFDDEESNVVFSKNSKQERRNSNSEDPPQNDNKNGEKRVDVVALLKPLPQKKPSRTVRNMDAGAQASSQMGVILSQAQQGDSQFQFVVAKNYLAGNNIDKNIDKGIEWLTLSAKNEHISAQLQLGTMFLNGEYVKKDLSQAYHWIKLAAEKGDSTAQLYLGDMYKKGWGIKRSNAKAIKWYRKSANHGNDDARKRLGGCRIC